MEESQAEDILDFLHRLRHRTTDQDYQEKIMTITARIALVAIFQQAISSLVLDKTYVTITSARPTDPNQLNRQQ